MEELTRRTAMMAIGGAAGLASLATGAPVTAATRKGGAALTPTTVDGPYYFDEKLVRQNITEGKLGIPLDVGLRIVDVSGRPVPQARVDVWHADAQGNYSEYTVTGDHIETPPDGAHFLRGTQITDQDGSVQFFTIYPGWYQPRTPHIHFKIFIGTRCILTAQMYFPDALSEYIYQNIPTYQRRELRDTLNVTDPHKAKVGDSTVGSISEAGGGYRATLELTVDRSADVPLRMPPEGHKPPYPPTLPILYGEARAKAVVPPVRVRA
ncbi:hypothetical protein [Sphingomonas sp.]|uniref:dioxygenase family protein n=1 Tax=Sphingomonas sp. TaxID=28214 RepID=UPI000DB8994F|nr:hypothetical protein [Sphingomonas sp.]PZU06502.1 MAG: intradiol ring-cleavage dioxygenase [Sphingomonas sp.]